MSDATKKELAKTPEKHPSRLKNNLKWFGGEILTTVGFALGVFTVLVAVISVPWVTIGVAAAASVGLMSTGYYVTSKAEKLHDNYFANGVKSASQRLDKKLEGLTPQEQIALIEQDEAKFDAKHNKKWTERVAPKEKASSWAEKLDRNKDEQQDILFEATCA